MQQIKNFILNNFKVITYILFFIPVIILLTYFLVIDLNIENLFLIFLFILIYYISIFYPIFFYYWKLRKPKNSIRSCFEFIKKINFIENYEFRNQTDSLVGVEVGVFRGGNAEQILKYLNIKKLYLIDPWVSYTNVNEEKGWSDSQETQNKHYEEVKYKFSKNNKVEIIREFSVNAAQNFANNFFDFIYIDGDHTYNEVFKDLNAWYPKLKQYGVMCGDDFGHTSGAGVMQAVIKFTNENNLQYNYSNDRQFWFVKS